MEIAITLVGTILTAIGTSVTIWQASKVRTYRRQIAVDLRKIHLSETSESLRRAQDDGRKLLTQVHQMNRGKSIAITCEAIQAHMDKALGHLHLRGEDVDIREIILKAQTKLRESQTTEEDEQRMACASSMHDHIQDAISLCKERIASFFPGDRHV